MKRDGRDRRDVRDDAPSERPRDGDPLAGSLVLVVEDDAVLAPTLELLLRHDGFRTDRVGDGQQAVQAWRTLQPDAIVLDLGLPGMDGTEVLRKIREHDDVPVLVLTARAEEIDEVAGLELGADDYLVKPVSAQKLLARVRALLRRRVGRHAASDEDLVRVGRLHVDGYKVEARWDGRPLPFTPSEWGVVAHLARTPGRAVSRLELLDEALAEGEATERTVDVHVAHVRRKLREAGATGDVVETVRGVGYRLTERPE